MEVKLQFRLPILKNIACRDISRHGIRRKYNPGTTSSGLHWGKGVFKKLLWIYGN